VWDVINVGIGAYSFSDNINKGNYGWAAVDALGLTYDFAATAVPFLPAGASAGLKAYRAGNSALDSAAVGMDVARVADHVNDAAKAINAAPNEVPWQAAIDGSKLHRKVGSEVDGPCGIWTALTWLGVQIGVLDLSLT
jgi:hypothetical protein